MVGFISEGVEAKGTINTLKYAEKFDKKTIIIDWFSIFYIFIYINIQDGE